MSVKFKGFTFKKVTDLQTLRQENALSSVSASAASNVSHLDQPRKIQTSMASFTLATPHKPVATVPPQGQKNLLSATLEESSNQATRLKEESSETSLKDNNSPLNFVVVDDDDDFDMSTLTPVTPRSQRRRDKKNSHDSDDEIIPMRRHRSMVLSSDEDDVDIPSGGNILPPSQRRSNLVSTKNDTPLSACRDEKSSRHIFAQRQENFCSSTPKILPRPQSFCPRSTIARKTIKTPSAGSVTGTELNADASQQETLLSGKASVTANRCSATPQQGETSLVPSMSSSRTVPNFQHRSLPPPHSVVTTKPPPGSESVDGDILKHPLLAADVSQLTKDHQSELQQLLLQAADEVCEIICTASTAAIMNLGVSDYTRLQALLAARKQIKDKQSTIHGSPARDACFSAQNCSSNPLRRNVMEAGPGKISIHTSPLACSTAVKRIPAMNFQSVATSPVPCGDSFFEDTDKFTQSHISYMRDSHSSTHTSPAEPVSTAASKSGRTSLESGASLPASQCSQMRKGAARSTQVSQCSGVVISDDSASILIKTCPDNSSSFRFDYEISTATRDHKPKQGKAPGGQRSVFLPGSDSVSPKNTIDNFEDGNSEDFDMAEVEEWDTQGCKTDGGTLKSPSVNGTSSETDSYIPVFGSTDRDDGATGEFDGESFPHSKDLRCMFHTVFGLREFRHNQLQAINAALLGHDCFILMPTGGGKSLCYQLPTLVSRGISVVVSPLRALIQDQVQRLIAFDIPAAHLSGEMDTGQANSVYSQLYQREPGVKLLYVTPEKLSASEKLLSCLESLFRRQLLDRFVIDEAHCVSQWGHDFRPDYKKLNVLRTKFPGVPVMALTATATPRVRRDIIHQLAMKEPKWFMQSFNRPNLKYSVNPKKPSNATADVIEMIKSKFKRDCGIIYCLSRKECDTVAEQLKKAGIEAESYHAGLSDSERSRVQDRWLNGDKCQVICATIAFGMGIDKADVRFVIHYSMPKSVEGYYQEAGRAGRDGMLAHCILLYTYSDVRRLRRIIELDQCATYESKKVHINNLFRMVHYCENVADCRRSQILHYFGEHHFDRDRCNMVTGALCDNCKSKDMFVVRNVTDDAKEVVKCVRDLTSNRRSDFTLLHIVEIFKGSQNTRIVELGHNKLALHGRGTAYSRSDAERLMHRLVIEGVLAEELRTTSADTTACYVMLGSKAADLMQDKIQIQMAVQGGRKRSKQCLIGQEPQTNRQQLIEECYKELLVLAKTIATEHGSKNYALIFPNAMLWQLAEKTPLTVEEMKKEIDGLPETKINKYGAHRFLDITTKFCVMHSTLPDDGPQDEDEEPAKTDDWASPYFSASSTSSGPPRRGFGRGKRGRPRPKKKNPHGVKRIGRSGTAGRGKGQRAHSSFTSGLNGRSSANPGPPRGTGASKSTLGMMPDPRARSYLASIGSYMG